MLGLMRLRLTRVFVMNRMMSTSSSISTSSSLSTNRTIAVAMSGGIDSSAVAMLLKDKGFDVIGVFMRNWNRSDEEGSSTTCPIETDRVHMRQVCDRLGIKAYDVDLSKEYWNDVFTPFVNAYASGYDTPNADVACNRIIKFGKFREVVKERFGVSVIATGHYARLAYHGRVFDIESSCFSPASLDVLASEPQLLRGVDVTKDQSYFLCMTDASNLRNTLFPLGQYTKAQVRQLVAARFTGLDVLSKRESTGVCFIGERRMGSFLRDYIPLTAGRFVDADSGAVMGEHGGKEALTIGQKARIHSQPDKYYVAWRPLLDHSNNNNNNSNNSDNDKSPSLQLPVWLRHLSSVLLRGDVVVCRGKNHPLLLMDRASVNNNDFHFVNNKIPSQLLQSFIPTKTTTTTTATTAEWESAVGLQLGVQVRHLDRAAPCTLKLRFHSFPNNNNNNNNNNSDDEWSLSRWRPHISSLLLLFEEPQRVMCPGQTAALYLDDICVGGATIAHIDNSRLS